MNDLTLANKTASAFREALGVNADVNLFDMEYSSSSEWDSVAHMTLVAALEQEFDCMLEMDDILDMSSYAKALEIMAKYV